MSALTTRDHPRIRGEHHAEAAAVYAERGIIPAYAGNTVLNASGLPCCEGSSPHTRGTRLRSRATHRRSWDHPRIRGEHLHHLRHLREKGGIIPAYAGNTVTKVCLALTTLGSSPHTRGTPGSRTSRGWFAWIIPAYAGNTIPLANVATPKYGSSPHTRGTPGCRDGNGGLYGDHPRIRGEHQRRPTHVHQPLGIIPAYAGNTELRHAGQLAPWGSSPHTRGTPICGLRISTICRDHPRIRGEHNTNANNSAQNTGIIPAYAGNTCSRCCVYWSRSGSSPHTRGTRLITSRFSGYSYNTQSLLQMSSAESICFPMLARPAPAASRCSSHCLRF